MTHTPRPWEAKWDSSNNTWFIFDVRGWRLAKLYLSTEHDANAKLIATAPDLLEACKDAVTFLVDEYPSAKPIRGLLAAITKATE